MIECRFAEAERLLRPYVLRHRGDLAGAYLLGRCLAQQGRLVESLHHLEKAASAPGAPASARIEHATVLYDAGKRAEALERMGAIARDYPGDAPAQALHATMLLRGGLFVDAMEACLRALHLAPEMGGALSTYASCLAGLGRAEESVEWYRKAVRTALGDADLRAHLCFALNATLEDPARVYEEHVAFGRLIEGEVYPMPAAAFDASPERRLRVGFVSPDLREHPVARFIEPVLRRLDRDAFEVLVYDVGPEADGVTRALRGLADGWCEARSLPDEALARRIREDRVDILIDLAGLTGNARPRVFAMRPAPVQATYLGYPNTTGLGAMDLRIVDAITDPAGAERLCREKLLRLEGCFVCMDPLPGAAGLDETPRRPGVAFGSFNNPSKVSDATLELWRSALDAVPGSRLVLKRKGLNDARNRQAFDRRFAARGIDPARIDVLPFAPTHAGHLAAYAHVDVTLDTFPYGGTTTTCESLAMGVPVLTLAGATHASRVGASLLTAAGFPEWIARHPTDYVRLAASLAQERPARRAVRERVATSALCDGALFARRFGAGLRGAWRARVAQQPGQTGPAQTGPALARSA